MEMLTNSVIDFSIRKSLGYNAKEASKWSIVECAKNEYLDPEFDPFELLKFELMAKTIREKYGFGEEAK